MNGTKSVALLLMGAVLGANLASPVANAAAEFVQTQRTPHPIYVDGERMELETYAIGGHNYVKLRDIGQAVGFEVYWDGSAAQIISGQPYTGQPPVDASNLSVQKNPSVFTPELTEEMYWGLRESLLHHREIAAGTYPPVSLGTVENDDYLALYRNLKLMDILESLGSEYSYTTQWNRDRTVTCAVRTFDEMSAAVEQAKSFTAELTGLSEKELVEKIVWYVCDHLTYNANSNSGPASELFVDGTAIEGKCETYAEWMKLLCEQAGIPCVKLQSEDHAWNCVYADGVWWDVDACWSDENKRMEAIPAQVEAHRRQETIFRAPDGWADEHHKPCNPESALFTKELLVPGSTK